MYVSWFQPFSRPQRPCSFWSAPRIVTFGKVQFSEHMQRICFIYSASQIFRFDSEHGQSDLGQPNLSKFPGNVWSLDPATILDKTVETLGKFLLTLVLQFSFPIPLPHFDVANAVVSCKQSTNPKNNIDLGEREIKYFYLLVSQDVLWVKFESCACTSDNCENLASKINILWITWKWLRMQEIPYQIFRSWKHSRGTCSEPRAFLYFCG